MTEEVTVTPEMLSKAVPAVVGLCKYNQAIMQDLLRGEGTDDRLERNRDHWEDVARQHPAFTDTIKQLWWRILFGYTSPAFEPREHLVSQAAQVFSEVENEGARRLLTDLYIARITGGIMVGIQDRLVDPNEEALAMTRELGVGSGLEGVKGVTLEGVVESILTQRLKLFRQTQKPE